MRNNSTRDITIDFVRIVACFAVVLMHVISVFWYPIPVKLLSIADYVKEFDNFLCTEDLGILPKTWKWYLLSLFDALTRFSVPVFVMISGAMVLNKKEVSIRYGINKCLYLLKIIFLWGGVLTVLQYFIHFINDEVHSLLYYVQTMINGGGVFWFLYMLMPLYLASSIYKAIVKDNNASLMFIILWFAMSVILPSLKVFYPCLTTNIKLEYITQFSVYSGYFVVGYILYHIKSSDTPISTRFNGTANIMCYAVSCIMLAFMIFGEPIGFYHNFTSPLCVCISIYTYWLLINLKISKSPMIAKIASSTLGIYSVHMLFVGLFTRTIDVSTFMKNDIFLLYILVVWILVIICSFVVVRILKSMPFLRTL